MDGSTQVLVAGTAENRVKGLFGGGRPDLGIRCSGGETDVVFSGGGLFFESVGRQKSRVRVRFDSGEPEEQLWGRAQRGTGLLASNPLRLVSQLAQADTFRLEFYPDQESPQIARFITSGLAEKLRSVAQACGWPSPDTVPRDQPSPPSEDPPLGSAATEAGGEQGHSVVH
jgi:hypothetical protein